MGSSNFSDEFHLFILQNTYNTQLPQFNENDQRTNSMRSFKQFTREMKNIQVIHTFTKTLLR